jgi:hypothetical protein
MTEGRALANEARSSVAVAANWVGTRVGYRVGLAGRSLRGTSASDSSTHTARRITGADALGRTALVRRRSLTSTDEILDRQRRSAIDPLCWAHTGHGHSPEAKPAYRFDLTYRGLRG